MSDHIAAPAASSVASISSNFRRPDVLEATGALALECAACHGKIGTQETCAVWTRGAFIVTAHLECVEFAQAIGATP